MGPLAALPKGPRPPVTIKASDLPPEVRKRLGIEGKARTSKHAEREDGPCPYRCGCGETFPSYGGRGGWKPHAEKTGHSRGSMVL